MKKLDLIEQKGLVSWLYQVDEHCVITRITSAPNEVLILRLVYTLAFQRCSVSHLETFVKLFSTGGLGIGMGGVGELI